MAPQFRENKVSGDELSIDILLLEEKEILHFVDIGTKFSAAIFLDFCEMSFEQSADKIWLSLQMYRCLILTGHPN